MLSLSTKVFLVMGMTNRRSDEDRHDEIGGIMMRGRMGRWEDGGRAEEEAFMS